MRMVRLSGATMARVKAAREVGIPLKVIVRALKIDINPHTLNSWCLNGRQRRVAPCPKFRAAFETLIREGK